MSSSSPSASGRSAGRRLLALLASLVLLPLAVVLAAAPAHAVPHQAGGAVIDALGDPVGGVTVTARPSPAYTDSASSTTTNADGEYALALTTGTYHLEFAKAGYVTAFYGGTPAVDVVVDGAGDLSVDGEPIEDNLLDDVTLQQQGTHPVTGTVTNGTTALSGIAVAIFSADDDETPVDSDITDASGAYRLDVPSGRYAVRYTDPTDTYLPTWYGGDTTPVEVEVAPNGSISTTDGPTGCPSLCAVTLTKPAANQKYPIAGQVVDANGEPVDGVAVAVTGVGASAGNSGTDTTRTVGEDGGVYSIQVLPGTYQVSFAKTGWVSTMYGGQTSPSVVTVSPTGTLSVAPAEDLTGNRLDDVVLASTPFAVTGTVRAAGGDPVQGIRVRAFPQGSTDPDTVVDTATSGPAGHYTVDLPVGSYDLELSDTDGQSPTYAATTLTDVKVAQGGAVTAGGSGSGLPDVTLALSSADTPHPVVGSVVDANGAEIDGLTVEATPVGSGTGDSDTTGADGPLGGHGRYRLQLKPGDYTIAIAGGADWKDTGYTAGGSSAALVTVQLNGTVLVNGTEAIGGELGETEVPGTTEYTLSGTVTDGTQGLPGITVTAYAQDDTTTPVATTTSSGATGGWSLAAPEGLVVGTYVVELSGTSGGKVYDKVVYGGATATPVEMAQGGVAKVGGSPLVPANTLPAVVLTQSSADKAHPVLGTVVDANGDPIDGVTVSGVPQGGKGTSNHVDTTVDDQLDHGRYRLPLKPGTYRLTFAKAGFTPATYPGAGLTPVDVEVELDGTVRATGAVVPGGELADVELGDATGTATISGRVVHDGSGVGGILVEVFPEGGELTAATRVGSATTTGDGAWSVGGLKIGEYTVRFTDDGTSDPVYNQTYLGGADLATSTPVKVGQGDVVSVGGVPMTGGALGDTAVTRAQSDSTYDVVGELDDEAGDPIQGATVTAVPQGTPAAGTRVEAPTDGDGGYRLALTPGTYQITYAATGFTGATYPGAGETPVPVVVKIGGEVQPGSPLETVTLEQTTGTTGLSGRVVTDGNVGVNDIRVEVFREGDTSQAAIKTAVTATSGGVAGTWSVTGLRIGVYTVRFTDNLPATKPDYIRTFLGGPDLASSTPVKVAQGNAVSVDDVPKPGGALGTTVVAQDTGQATYPLLGSVVDPNGDPLTGVTVTATAKSGGANATTTTDAEGGYVLQVKAGTYEVSYTKATYTSVYYLDGDGARAQIVVTASGATIGGEAVVDLTLDDVTLISPTTTHDLKGRVLGDGSPLAGITVRAVPEDTALATVTTASASDGRFTLKLPVGTYKIEYVGKVVGADTWDGTFYGGAATPASVKVATGGTITVVDGDEVTDGLDDVTLERSTGRYLVRGSVSDENGDPLGGVTVRALKAGTTTQAGTATSAEDGTYAVEVPVGRYNLRFEKAGKATTWLLNADSETGAVAVVTVAAGGGITAPGVSIDGGVLEDVTLLRTAATFKTLPRLTGKAVVGQVLTTTFGVLNGASIDKDYVTVEWFVSGRPADDYADGDYFQRFRVPAIAATRTVSYRITIDDPDGLRAATVFTSKAVAIPKAPAKVTGKVKKRKLVVKVSVPGLARPTGTVVVKEGRRKVGVVKLTVKSKGSGTLALKKLKKGKHKLTLTYSGAPTVAAAKATVTIKL